MHLSGIVKNLISLFLTILAVLKLSAHKHDEHFKSLEVCRLRWDYIPDSTFQVTLLDQRFGMKPHDKKFFSRAGKSDICPFRNPHAIIKSQTTDAYRGDTLLFSVVQK